MTLLVISTGNVSGQAPENNSVRKPLIAPRPEIVRVWLGVQTRTLSTQERTQIGQNLKTGEGVQIAHLFPNSPAHQAGFRAHDILIKTAGRVIKTPQQLARLIQQQQPNSRLEFEILRDQKPMTVHATLGSLICDSLEVGTRLDTQKKAGQSLLSEVVILSKSGTGLRLSIPKTKTTDAREFTLKSKTLEAELKKLPEGLRATVEQLLPMTNLTFKNQRSLKLSLKPTLKVEQLVLMVILTRPVENDIIRVFALSYPMNEKTPLPLKRLLEVELLTDELKQLPNPVRKNIERMFERTQLPPVQRSARQAQ